VDAGGEIADGLAQGNGMLAHNRLPITAGRPQIWLELPQPDTGLLCCFRRSENEGSPEVVMPNVSVTSAEFQKNFGRYRETAIREAVTITNHGRDSLVLLSSDEYRRLKKRDREVLHVSELSDQDIEAIRTAEVPVETAAFDHELES